MAAIYEDGNYGMRGMQELEKEAKRKGVCFAEKVRAILARCASCHEASARIHAFILVQIAIDVDNPESQHLSYYTTRLRRLYETRRKARG